MGAARWFQETLLTRPIPASGERIPAVGLETDSVFTEASRFRDRQVGLREIVRLFLEAGGTLVDAPPTYQPAERLVSDLVDDLDAEEDVFWAAKLSILASGAPDSGMIQLEQTLDRLGRIDLYQIHNLLRWQVQLPQLRRLKEEGRFRYLGITTSSPEQHADLEAVLETEPFDFVQLDYAVDNRGAEGRLLPLARDRGIAVLANSPFSRGSLFRRVAARPFPAWAREFGAETWAQFFLKWVLSNETVTAVLPGTSDPDHLRENMRAGTGRLPNSAERARMTELVDALPGG